MTLIVGCCLATAASVPAQQAPRGFLRLEAGRADIHRPSSAGALLALRFGRGIDRRGIARLEVGASYSAADQGYVALELGVEVRPLAGGVWTPVAGGGVGLLAEPDFTGEVVRATVALEIALSARTAVRLGAQAGRHGGIRGPNAYFGALEVRGGLL